MVVLFLKKRFLRLVEKILLTIIKEIILSVVFFVHTSIYVAFFNKNQKVYEKLKAPKQRG